MDIRLLQHMRFYAVVRVIKENKFILLNNHYTIEWKWTNLFELLQKSAEKHTLESWSYHIIIIVHELQVIFA